MKIVGKDYDFVEIMETMSIPDCWTLTKLNATTGHGEAKFYVANKEPMHDFYGCIGFKANCFILKNDLKIYMKVMEDEYKKTSQAYRKNEDMPELYSKRLALLENIQEEQIWFTIEDQHQITGPRGYVNSSDFGYKLIRELCLPIISSICAMKLRDVSTGEEVFYWKPFPDWNALNSRTRTHYKVYGKKKDEEQPNEESMMVAEDIPEYGTTPKGRKGQAKYREELLKECPMCPFTQITDERLLVASHIKPWAVSSEKEKIDGHNGFMLSPLYDRLFDKGLMTIHEDRTIELSNWLDNYNRNKLRDFCGLIENKTYPLLPMDEKRIEYLKYHQQYVFRG